MKYLVVIPARGGSKGIPKKNIYIVAGKPLLQYSIDMIQKVDFDGDIVVSTDDDDIASVALDGTKTVYKSNNIQIGKYIGEKEKYKAMNVVYRPEEISGDEAKTEDALIHALDVMESYYGYRYNAVVTLQATSPLRKEQTIQECFRAYELERKKYNALITLSETRADYWIRNEDGSYQRLYPDAPRRRQERKPMYVENSALYITDAKVLKETRIVLGSSVNGFVISEDEAIDINEPMDIIIAEELIKQKQRECFKE